MIHTVKCFSIVNKIEVDFFWISLGFLYVPTNVGSLISGSSALSKPSLYIWKFLVLVLLKLTFKDFEHYLPSMWNKHNCMVVWTFLCIAFLWDWNENWPFFSPVATAEFSKLKHICGIKNYFTIMRCIENKIHPSPASHHNFWGYSAFIGENFPW